MNKKQEMKNAQQTEMALQAKTSDTLSPEDRQTFQLGQLLRESATTDLPERSPELRVRLLEELERTEVTTPAGLDAYPDARLRRWAMAASILLMLGVGSIYLFDIAQQDYLQASKNRVEIAKIEITNGETSSLNSLASLPHTETNEAKITEAITPESNPSDAKTDERAPIPGKDHLLFENDNKFALVAPAEKTTPNRFTVPLPIKVPLQQQQGEQQGQQQTHIVSNFGEDRGGGGFGGGGIGGGGGGRGNQHL